MRPSLLRTSPARGFSLIELLLVMVLLVTIGGLVAVRMGAGIDHDRLVVASRDLAATLRMASDRAQLVGRRHRVVLELEANALEVEEEEDPLERPNVWSAIGLTWARKRVFGTPVRFGAVSLDPDDEDLVLTFEPDRVEELRLVFDPEGVHVVKGDAIEELDQEPVEAVMVQIALRGSEPGDGSEPDTLYVRLQPTGEVVVWTGEQHAAHVEELEGLKR